MLSWVSPSWGGGTQSLRLLAGGCARLAVITLLVVCPGCTYLSEQWDRAAGRETARPESRQQMSAARKRAPVRQAPSPVLPPPPTWSATLPGGAKIKFGAGEAFSQVDPRAEAFVANALVQGGWAREFGSMPSVYFIEIDNRHGRSDVSWGIGDRVVLAAEGRTFEQDTGFMHRASLKPFGGFEQTVLPGTSGVVPVAFVDPVPLRAISTLRIMSGSVTIPLTCDAKPVENGGSDAAAPGR